jgi:Holliday junction resolvase RusA-like endonuclease
MKAKRITTFRIEPVTAVRTTKNQKWLLKVSKEKAQEYQDRKFEREGKRSGIVALKKQMERYNAYKEWLRLKALEMDFKMPSGHFAIWFCVPMPESWRSSKVEANVGKPKITAPDADNYLKAVMDGLMPRKNKRLGEVGADDRRIHCFAVFKIWVKRGDECVKIVEYDEKDFMKEFMIA